MPVFVVDEDNFVDDGDKCVESDLLEGVGDAGSDEIGVVRASLMMTPRAMTTRGCLSARTMLRLTATGTS